MVYKKRSFQTTRKIALVDRATRMEEPDSCFDTWVNTLLLIIRPLWAVYIRLFTFGFLSLLLGPPGGSSQAFDRGNTNRYSKLVLCNLYDLLVYRGLMLYGP